MFACWGWSDNSQAEAETMGRANAEKVAARAEKNHSIRHHYGYGADRPLREPILREFRDQSGNLVAVITRNNYGCQVLNTARIMFIDVDLPQPKSEGGLGKLLKGLFGGAKAAPPAGTQDSAQAGIIAKARRTMDRHPDWGWRIYRTRAGFRLLATHQLFDPVTAAGDPAFDEVGVDPLYRQLCKIQKCFRARLTPKPWRCETNLPPVSWPWNDAQDEQYFKLWEATYVDASAKFATCELLTTIGNPEVDPVVSLIVAAHDEISKVGTRLPLA